MSKQAEFVVLVLRALEDGAAPHEFGEYVHCPRGLCKFTEQLIFGKYVSDYPRLDAWEDFLDRCAKSWDEYSGDLTYPVPSFSEYEEAHTAYHTDRWGDHDYGDARRRYCGHIANCIEEAEL